MFMPVRFDMWDDSATHWSLTILFAWKLPKAPAARKKLPKNCDFTDLNSFCFSTSVFSGTSSTATAKKPFCQKSNTIRERNLLNSAPSLCAMFNLSSCPARGSKVVFVSTSWPTSEPERLSFCIWLVCYSSVLPAFSLSAHLWVQVCVLAFVLFFFAVGAAWCSAMSLRGHVA